MRNFEGRVAAITGAGSGIGRALALALADRGCHLALSDVDPTALAAAAAAAEQRTDVRVSTATLDVADREAVHRWADEVVADHGVAHLVVNNAGVSLTATVADMSDDGLDWLMAINFWGVVNGTRAFLPHLRAAGEGHIVNLSSVFGLVGIPSQSAYNAAKFGVRGFTEALRIELELEDCGVSATTVHPGGIQTNIARHGRYEGPEAVSEQARIEMIEQAERLFRTSPDKAAATILRGVERNRRRVLVGFDAHVFSWASRLPAAAYMSLVRAGAGRRRP